MARYWRQGIGDSAAPTEPPVGPLAGLQVMSRARWEAPMRAQDHTCAAGRRVIMQCGIGADSGWRFVSGAPVAGALSPYGVASARLTSGSFLRGTILYLPSGGVGGDTATPDLAEGTLRLDVTWTASDASVETHTVNVELTASTVENFTTLTGAGAAWGEMRSLNFVVRPPVSLADDVVANRWTVSPHVDIEAYQVGGTRIVDFCLHESPVQVCMESDDEPWSSHVFATGNISGPSGAASNRPRTRRSETSPDGNPRGGTRQTLVVATEQRRLLGPTLLRWGNYREHAELLDGIERLGTATGMVGLFDASQTSYDPDREGMSVSCGGYARDWKGNNAQFLGEADSEAVIPVVFRVWGSTSSGTTRLRLHTSDHSWVECLLTTTSGWHVGWGHLKVGVNASDPVIAQVFVTGAQTVDVYAFALQRMAQ